jgi:DNA repair exonuclease SbcCD ATPase subunit
MIVLRLEVSGFRCWRERVAVEFDPGRINILHGPNGSGKSTLLWALARALLDTHRAGGKAVEELRPWGTGLAPKIAVEFEHSGQRYRLEKGFLENRGARLEECRDERFLPVAEYEKAEDIVLAMLLADRAPKGLATPEVWGLARALWCPQDYLAVEELDERVLGAVRQVLGQTGLDPYASRLKQRVEEACDEYWTPAGKPRRGKNAPEWVQLEETLAERRGALEQERRRLDEFHTAQDTARQLEAARAAAAQRRDHARRRVEELEAKLTAWRQAAAETKALEAQWRARQQEAVTLNDRVEQLNKARHSLSTIDARILQIDAELPERLAGRAQLEAAVASLRRQLGSLQEDEERLASRESLLAEAESYVRCRGEAEELERLVGRAAQLSARLDEAQDALRSLVAPDDRTLAQIEKLVTERAQLETRLEGALLHVELAPHQARRVEVIRGDAPGVLELAAGQTARITGSPVIELELEGFGRLVVSGPAEGVAELRAKLKESGERLANLTAPYGTGDLEELRRRRERGFHLEAQISHTRQEFAGLLGGRSLEALQERLSRIREEIGRLEEAHPEWSGAPPALDELRAALSSDRAALQDRRRSLDAELAARQHGLTAAGQECARLAAERDALSGQRRDIEVQIRDLESDGLTDAERARRAREAAVEATGFKERYERQMQALQALAPDPEPELDRARRDLEAAEKASEAADRDYHHHLGLLANLAAQAPYETVARLEEEIETLRARMETDRARAEALRRLRDEIAACEAEAGSALIQPVAERASKLLARIAGGRLRSIQLGEKLGPQSVLPRDAGAEAPLDALSAGEREQVHVAVRLALAGLLTKDAGERHLVALDDVLVVTDEDRLRRVLELLEELRPHAQLVILTCHPERYRSLPAAHFIDAAALSSSR